MLVCVSPGDPLISALGIHRNRSFLNGSGFIKATIESNNHWQNERQISYIKSCKELVRTYKTTCALETFAKRIILPPSSQIINFLFVNLKEVATTNKYLKIYIRAWSLV